MKTIKIRQRIRKTFLFTSFLFFPATYYYLSPALPFAGLADSVISGSMMLFGGLFLTSLFFGRIFCGWLCPGGGLQDCVAVFRPEPAKRKKIRWIKFALWIVWLGFYCFMLIKGGRRLQPDFFYQTELGFSVSSLQSLIIYLMISSLLLVLPLVLGRRGACHTVCWMAPFMITGRKIRNLFRWPALKLNADVNACISCGRCSSECPMSIDVMKNVQNGLMEDQDCVLCGACVDICPKDVLRFSYDR